MRVKFHFSKFLKLFKTFETHEKSHDFASKLKAFKKFFGKCQKIKSLRSASANFSDFSSPNNFLSNKFSLNHPLVYVTNTFHVLEI